MRYLFSFTILLLSVCVNAQIDKDRLRLHLISENETIPESMEEIMSLLDSLLTENEKQDLIHLDLSKDENSYWSRDISHYKLSTDFLERLCMYYDLFHQTPRFLTGRGDSLYSKIYDIIVRTYIKHLKGEPYKNYYDFPTPKNIEDFFNILENGGWPEALEVLKQPMEEIEVVDIFERTEARNYWKFKIQNVIYYDMERSILSMLSENIMSLDSINEMRPEAIEKIILVAANKHFTGQDFNLKDLVSKYSQYREIPMWLNTKNDDLDSINGVYVPVDVADACRELDKLLDDSTKVQIVELGKEFNSTAHHTMGMWIRNNWGLWGGSRLQAYLQGKGYKDPDDMSDYILTCYQFWLESKDNLKIAQ